MYQDPIADYLTRIRNANNVKKRVVEIPFSKVKRAITEILHDQGYILNYRVDTESTVQGVIKIALKYDSVTKEPVLKKIVRMSKPGLRKYVGYEDMPRILNGMGTVVVSTSKGVMTGNRAKREKIGGEVLCYFY